MNKIELLQEKYNANKNDMTKEELLEFNEHLFKSFLSDKKANDDVFWAYSEITDRVIEDLKEKNEKLLNDTDFERFGKSEYIKKLEFETKHYRRLSELKESEKNKIRTDNKKLEKKIKEERSLSNQLSFQAELHDRDIVFFQQAIKEQRGIVIGEVVELLDKEVGNFNTFTEWMSVKKLVVLKTKIKEMGNK